MKCGWVKRALSLLLMVCLLLALFPVAMAVMEAEAIGGVNSLTCSGFISNSTARNYIDTMMRYYINSSSTLQSTLNNGNSVVFMFEGGSDNYWSGTTYSDNDYSYRTQAVCIVVKKNSAGNAYIDYYCENSSSIPAEPTWCTNGVAYSGSTTLMDGTYAFYTWNHTGPYAAFQIDLSSSNGYCYYTPSANLNGYKAGASGINIHTRSTAYNGGSSIGWAWSEGCQVIGYGNDSSNEFNAFMKSVTGITWNPWISWTNKTLNTWASVGTYKGYFVVDRQLGMIGTNGAEYGTGSLINLYNKTALTNITAKSTAAREAAGASGVGDYVSQCTYYPAYGKLVCTGIDVWSRTLPCYADVNSSTAAISSFNQGDVLTCTGLFKNTVGEYWYRVQSASGTPLYIRAAYMEFKEQYLTDITIKDHTKPNGHVYDTGFVVDGTISTTYNQLTAVSAYVYTGFGTKGETSTGYRATVSNNTYSLAGSTVDSNVWMNLVPKGPNTMVISAEYKNCYVVNDTTLKTNTGTITLASDYFMVIPTAVNQSSCSHSYENYPIDGGSVSCTSTAKAIKACKTCGLISGEITMQGSHSFGDWVTVNSTCTVKGSKTRTCSACGAKETTELPLANHNYNSVVIGGTCTDYGQTRYTCTNCGDSYTTPAGPVYSEWSSEKPSGVSDNLIETKTEYRYSDYEEIKSYNASESGYTQVKKEWEQSGSGTVYYVTSWPSGFDKTSSIYSQYNGTKITASESTNAKTVINSDGLSGYIYYHWCAPGSYYSYNYKNGNYTTFHAYYSTTSPSNYECDTTDMSYKTSNTSCCTNSNWYFAVNVNAQKYTEYKAKYTHSRWTDWSAWSETPVSATDTRKVETRTFYRYIVDDGLGEHNYVNDVCTYCGKNAKADYMYLFGYINGKDYADKDDAANAGIYKFIDGKLVATFSEVSYVGVKRGDNSAWYMTDGYQGENVTSVTLYNTEKGINAEKLYVPKGKEITFTLTDNGDDTYTLSYVTAECKHESHNLDGNCASCGDVIGHTFSKGACTGCGKPCDHNFENSVCTVCSMECIHSFSGGSCVICHKVCEHNFEDSKCTICSAPCEHNFEESVCTVCGKACEHNFENGECSTCHKVCEHSFSEGACTLCGKLCEHNFSDGACLICGATCVHSWENSTCKICSTVCTNHSYVNSACVICGKAEPDFYLFGFINGKNYGCEEDENNAGIYKFVNGTLRTVFAEESYVAVKRGDNSEWYMTDGYAGNDATSATLYDVNTGINADKLFVPKGRLVTFALENNNDGTLNLSYEVAPCSHATHTAEGICVLCGEVQEHSFRNGACVVCSKNCEHSFVDGQCTICSYQCKHLFDDGQCVTCGTVCTHDFADGYCTACQTPCEHSFEEGGCTVCGKVCEHEFDGGICANCGTKCTHNFENGICTICYEICSHTAGEGSCGICGKAQSYYLAGVINGTNTGCEENYNDNGYAFENGTLKVKFDTDSFVFVKTQNNENWYMAEDAAKTSSKTFANINNGGSDMMFVPAGVEVTFTLGFIGDDKLSLAYTVDNCEHICHSKDAICTACGVEVVHNYNDGFCTVCSAKEPVEEVILPVINAKYASLSTEKEFFYEVVFSVENCDEVSSADMGLMMFANDGDNLTADAAISVVEGVCADGADFVAKSDFIHPKTLGDTVYLRVYAKLADGSYVYSEVIAYSGAQYAYSVLRNPAATKDMKSFAVALLNFAAEMQIYFDYNKDNLANAQLTSEQKAFASAYRADMVAKTPKVDANKTVNFAKTAKLTTMYPTADFNSDLFTLSYNIKIKNTVPAEVNLYYWNAEAFDGADILNKENASGVIAMSLQSDGTYKADINDITAANMNDTIYVSVVYTTADGDFCTGVTAYSLAQYLKANAGKTSDLSALAQASVVYGYYSKNLYDLV